MKDKRSSELLSSARATPKGAYMSISRQLAPSNSSVRDEGFSHIGQEDEDDYQSIWAVISNSVDQ